VVAGSVYAATVTGVLAAFAAKDGEPLWTRPFANQAAIITSPVVAAGMVYVGDAQGILHAVDGATGDERWQTVTGSFLSSPAVIGGVIYIGGDDGWLRAFADSIFPAWPE
jgi:outer membrane protein assembly factor BamB